MVLRLLVLASLAILLLAPQVAAGGVRQKPFVITRVGLGPHGFVALQNGASITASLGGVSICQGRQCYVLPRVRVAPHRTVLIARDGGRGLKHVVARNARFGSLRPHDGEIALFSSRRIHKARTLFAPPDEDGYRSRTLAEGELRAVGEGCDAPLPEPRRALVVQDAMTMWRMLIGASVAACALALSACGGSSKAHSTTNGGNGTTTVVHATTVSRVQATFSIEEVGLGSNGYVTLENFTGVAEPLGGLVVCQGSHCQKLAAAQVAPGKRVRIAVGDGKGVENVVMSKVDLGTLKPSDGEVAIYANGDAQHPKDIVNYVQWGSTPHARTAAAVKAGLWLRTAYAPTSPKAVRLYKRPSGLWLFSNG
jgi:hypothetical protein